MTKAVHFGCVLLSAATLACSGETGSAGGSESADESAFDPELQYQCDLFGHFDRDEAGKSHGIRLEDGMVEVIMKAERRFVTEREITDTQGDTWTARFQVADTPTAFEPFPVTVTLAYEDSDEVPGNLRLDGSAGFGDAIDAFTVLELGDQRVDLEVGCVACDVSCDGPCADCPAQQ